MQVSLIIPAYNEEKRISSTLDAVSGFMREHFDNYEIIVIDDGSTDKTTDLVSEHIKKDENIKLIPLRKNKGKGYAVKTGVRNSTGDYIFFTDADLPYSLDTILKGTKILSDKKTKLVIGSRDLYEHKHNIPYPIYRRLMSKTFSFFLNMVLGLGISDTQCGIKGFEKKAAKRIFEAITIEGFGFDVELLYIAKKYKYKICCIPVNLTYNKGSKINIVIDSIKMTWDVFNIKLNDLRGLYKKC